MSKNKDPFEVRINRDWERGMDASMELAKGKRNNSYHQGEDNMFVSRGMGVENRDVGAVRSSTRLFVVENMFNTNIKVSSPLGLVELVESSNEGLYGSREVIKVKLELRDICLERINLDINTARYQIDKLIVEQLIAQRNHYMSHADYMPGLKKNLLVTITIGRDGLDNRGRIVSNILSFTIDTDKEEVAKNTVPNPREDMLDIMNEVIKPDDEKMLHSLVFKVDPDGVLPNLYTNLYGAIAMIPNIVEAGKDTGVYGTIRGKGIGKRHFHLSLEDARDLDMLRTHGIYTSEIDAKRGGVEQHLIGLEKYKRETSKELYKLEEENKNLKNELNYIKDFNKRVGVLEGIEKRVLANQSKYHLDIAKTNASKNDFMDSVKAIGLVVTTGVTLYKVFA